MLDQFQKLEAAGAGAAHHPDHDRRNTILDELQDAVGLNGKMVMEADIVKRAKKAIGKS